MSERFKEPVLKTGDSQEPWVRIPLSPPHFFSKRNLTGMSFGMQKYPSGRRGSPAKGVGRVERREGSNPSFSAKKKSLEPQWFKAFSFVFQGFFRISGRYGRTRENAGESCKNPVVIHTLLTCSIPSRYPTWSPHVQRLHQPPPQSPKRAQDRDR